MILIITIKLLFILQKQLTIKSTLSRKMILFKYNINSFELILDEFKPTSSLVIVKIILNNENEIIKKIYFKKYKFQSFQRYFCRIFLYFFDTKQFKH